MSAHLLVSGLSIQEQEGLHKMAISLTPEQTLYVKEQVAQVGQSQSVPFFAKYVLAWQTRLGVVLADEFEVIRVTAGTKARNGWEENDATFRATVALVVADCLLAWPSVS